MKETKNKKPKTSKSNKGIKLTNKHGLTVRQEKFALEFVKNGNATKAYLDAGYSCTTKSAEVLGSKALGNIKVSKYIKELLDKLKSESIADTEEILMFLTNVMRGKVKDQYSNIPAVKERKDAALALGKRHGLFSERVVVTGSVQHEHRGPSVADELITGMFREKEEDKPKHVS